MTIEIVWIFLKCNTNRLISNQQSRSKFYATAYTFSNAGNLVVLGGVLMRTLQLVWTSDEAAPPLFMLLHKL
jgi:hypothetical protein